MLFRLKKCQNVDDFAQKSREMYAQRHEHGQQKLTPITLAGRAVKQWLQTTGDTRDLEGYRMCTYTYTSPTAMVLISVGCATPQEPQEQPKPGYQKITEMLGETKPNRGILPNPCSFDGHPSQSHSEKLRRFTSLKIWTTYKPPSQPHALAWCYNYSTAFNHCLQPLKLETDLQTRTFQPE